MDITRFKYYALGAITLYVTFRYLIWILLPHFFALFALLIVYATYQSLFVYRSAPPLPNHFFLTKDEVYKVSTLQRPILQFPLAGSGGRPAKEFKRQPPSRILSNAEMDSVVQEMLEYVSRDFVSSWYSSISDNPDFIYQVDMALHHAVSELITRISSVDFTQIILLKLTNMLTQHVREIQNAEKLVKASRLNIQDQIEFSKQVALHYAQGKLHPAVSGTASDPTEQEHQYLRKRVKPLVPLLLPPKESSNNLLLILVREILVTVILQPLVTTFSDPDYWNQTFDLMVGAFNIVRIFVRAK
jgi:hypothetical protein